MDKRIWTSRQPAFDASKGVLHVGLRGSFVFVGASHHSLAPFTDLRNDGTTAVTPTFFNVTTASSGDTTIISADATHTLRVMSLAVFASGATNIYFTDATANLRDAGFRLRHGPLFNVVNALL